MDLVLVSDLPFRHGGRRLSAAFLLGLLQVCTSAAAQSSALAVVESLAQQEKACVVTSLSSERLREFPIAAARPGPEGQFAALEAPGLTVLEAEGTNLLAIADLRLNPDAEKSEDATVLGSRLLAALPADVWAEQLRAGKEIGEQRFGLRTLPQLAQELVREWLHLDGPPGPEAYGCLSWHPGIWLRDDAATPATMDRLPLPSYSFREPPFAVGNDQHVVASGTLPWLLWEPSLSPWAQAPCPAVPQGDTNLRAILAAACVTDSETGLRVHPSARLVEDRPVFVQGQPSCLGALVWALRIAAGVRCRGAEGAPASGAEVFYTSHPERAECWDLASLPSRGYVSPASAPVVTAMLADSDYGHILPLHACWPLSDLPPLYTWVWGECCPHGTSRARVFWVQHVSLEVSGLRQGVTWSAELPVI